MTQEGNSQPHLEYRINNPVLSFKTSILKKCMVETSAYGQDEIMDSVYPLAWTVKKWKKQQKKYMKQYFKTLATVSRGKWSLRNGEQMSPQLSSLMFWESFQATVHGVETKADPLNPIIWEDRDESPRRIWWLPLTEHSYWRADKYTEKTKPWGL